MAKESRLVQKLADAFDSVTGATTFWNEISDSDLYEVTELLWAWHLDAQNEWVRRQMLKAGEQHSEEEL